MLVPRRRPVGDIDEQVELDAALATRIGAIAREHREAQVVTDERANAPVAELDDEPVGPGRVALVFARHAEEVTLVVPPHRAVGRGPDEAIEHAVAIAELDAPRDRRVE